MNPFTLQCTLTTVHFTVHCTALVTGIAANPFKAKTLSWLKKFKPSNKNYNVTGYELIHFYFSLQNCNKERKSPL